jgi:hypothetical protein
VSNLASGTLPELSGSDGLDLGRLVLDAVAKTGGLAIPDERIDRMVVDGSLSRTMEGASTLTLQLHDPLRALLRSGVCSTQCDMELDGVWWRSVQVTKQGDGVTMTFEDRAVSLLRLYSSPRKASRDSMTRAEFAQSLVREVKPFGGIRFVSPQLATVQPVAITSKSNKLSNDPATRAASVQQGLSPSAKLSIEGSALDAEQRDLAQRMMDVASSLNAGTLATLALIEACIDESTMRNITYGTGSSTGILQVLQTTGQDMGVDPMNPEQCANAFLTRGFTGKGGAIALAAQNPGWSAGTVAQAVQGSAFADPYDRYQADAEAIVTAYGGVSGGGTMPVGTGTSALAAAPTTVTETLPYQFTRGGTNGKRETSWACLQRLAQEVNWRCFVTSNACYFAAETALLAAKPVLAINERTQGVDGIDFDVDNGKAISESHVTARATRWGVPPGSVVELLDCGPADGRWLVTTIERSLFDPESTITLKRATAPLKEPPNPTKTISVPGAALSGPSASDPGMAGSALGGQAPDVIAQLYQAAIAFSAKRWPYVWGGGHAHAGVADNPQIPDPWQGGAINPGIGFDCSGTQAAILSQVGMGFTPGQSVPGSGTMAATWGDPGPGQFFTLYANNDHVFSYFHTSTGDQHFGTDVEPDGFQPSLRSTDGFTPRHWPGC